METHSEVSSTLMSWLERLGVPSPMYLATIGELGSTISCLSQRSSQSFRILSPRQCSLTLYNNDDDEISENLVKDDRITLHFEAFSPTAQQIKIYGRARITTQRSSTYNPSMASQVASANFKAVALITISRVLMANAGPLISIPSESTGQFNNLSSHWSPSPHSQDDEALTSQHPWARVRSPPMTSQPQSDQSTTWSWPGLGDSCCAS